MPLNLTKRDGLFLLIAIGLVAFYVLVTGEGFPLDDSWIHQTFGRNLAQNGEWAFIPGQQNAASTSPLYTVLLAVGYKLGIPYLLWTHSLGVLALWATAMLGARLAEIVAPDSKYAGLITGLALLLTWHLLWAAASGMETMFMGMMALLLIWLAWRELVVTRDHATNHLLMRGAFFGIITALAALTRPEAVMLGGMIGLFMLIARPQGTLLKIVIWGSAAAVGFALAIAPYLLLNLQLTGGLLPDTAAAKFQQHAILLSLPYTTRFYDLAITVLSGGQFLLLPGAIVYAAKILKRENSHSQIMCLLPLFWFIALIMLYAARLPASYQHGRYVMPVLPAFVLAGVTGSFWILKWGRFVMWRRIVTRALVASSALTFGYFAAFGATVLQTDVAVINGEMVESAKWIAENLPQDELLAIHDIGAVGYFAPRDMLDIAGLVSPEAIPIVADSDALWELMQERDAHYLMAFPNQIPAYDLSEPDKRLCLLFTTGAEITRQLGEPNMSIYRLDWDATCEP